MSQILQSKPYLYHNTFGIDALTGEHSSSADHTNGQEAASGKEGLESLISSLKNIKDFNRPEDSHLTEGNLTSLKDLFTKNLTKKNKNKKKKYEVDPISQKVGSFTFVTKPKPLDTNIFEGFLSPYWSNTLRKDVGFFIETWGRPLLPSDCTARNPMINIRKLAFGSALQKETQDHSKWAISSNRSFALVCVGDLNHQSSQSHRGGSFFCIQDAAVYGQFSKLIIEHDCSGGKNTTVKKGLNSLKNTHFASKSKSLKLELN